MYNQLDSVPTFIEGNLSYKRKEDDGSLTIMSRKHPEVSNLLFNRQAVNIKELCNSKNTINDIVNTLVSRYEDIDKDIIKKDVLNIMHNFWRLGLIKWENGHPFSNIYLKEDGKYIYKMLTEDETVKTLKNLNMKDLMICPYYSRDYYNEKIVRPKVFTFGEIFYKLKLKNEDNGQGALIFSLIKTNNYGKSLRIGIWDMIDNLDPGIVNRFLNWAVKKYEIMVNQELFRVDLCLLDSIESYNKSRILFSKMGFDRRGRFTKEVIGTSSDTELYSLDVVS